MVLRVMTDEQRTHPRIAAPERDMLIDFLDYQRDTLLWKLDGLDDEQLRRPHQPSGLTLLGMVKHLTGVERGWFRERVSGEQVIRTWSPAVPDADWRLEPDDTPATLIETYRAECAASNDRIRTRDLDEAIAAPRPHEVGKTLRWVMLHMIEETARHVGHADLMREVIDGQTGE